MSLRPRTLRGRVALGSALCIALSGALVATTVVLLSDRMTNAREDAQLRAAAGVLIYELSTKREAPGWLADDEARELAETGIQIAIFAGQRRLGGSVALQPQEADRCEDHANLRSCARAAGALTVVAARDVAGLHEHRQATLLAALCAVLAASLLGAFAALIVARAVVQPLAQLQRRVERVPSDEPARADLGPASGVEEVDRLRESLSVALARLGVALQQAQRFASDAAHELRTPLTAIIAALDLARERAPLAEDAELVRAQRVARRLAGLVDRLLILARSDAPAERMQDVDLRDLLEDVIDTLSPAQRARVHFDPSPALTRGDPLLLLSMFANALDNSLKFSSGPVFVRITPDGPELLFSVEDEGPGIPEQEREHVFAPFYRTRESRAGDVPGHGIGLALIAHVTRLHGGRARFAARTSGARLEIRLPA